jgi:uncharacterized membrane protein YgcG
MSLLPPSALNRALRLGLAIVSVSTFALAAQSTLPSISVQAQGETAGPCPNADKLGFQDVSTFVQTGYANPELEVTCTSTQMIVVSNGIPNFKFVQTTPSALLEQNYTFTIPLEPVVSATPADVPLMGALGVAVNGIPIFGPTESANMGYADPYLDQILDYCAGHTAQRGDYHVHARPDCMFPDLVNNTNLIIGYAFDGYPIYAPYICADAACTSVEKVESSWQLKANTGNLTNAWEIHEYVPGKSKLDQCNGMTMPDGTYRYFSTDSFPYFIGCYHGEAVLPTGFGGAGGGQGGGGQGGGGQGGGGQGGGQGGGGQGGGNPPPPPGGGNPPPPPGGRP